ncbi:hypothetical protein Rhe02_74950 [Rhizocola hellebori]|uniref:Uncharacterized protein n=1 Tax=Rhizocola hellebori TaxID=1392758 RepID=A0A8J3QHA9_9ACTN|nr:WXG100 family type VII secretion target [Rhizocola hellebori]GIH09428.1 hypothetical protein Rhe02_74950 [Rhizocola hellebori]
MVTYRRLQGIDPGEFRAVARQWATGAQTAQAAQQELTRVTVHLPDNWQGVAGDAAAQHFIQLREELTEAGAKAAHVAAVLDHLADEVAAAKTKLADAVQIARSRSLDVSDAGVVSAPNADNQVEVSPAQARINHAVSEASMADHRAAKSLSDPQPLRSIFLESDTDLGKFSHGNFDYNYDPNEPSVTIVVRVKYDFEEGISEEEKLKFKAMTEAAVRDGWNERAELVPADGTGPSIPVRVVVQENNDSYHKVIDVEQHRSRPWVGMDLNTGIDDGEGNRHTKATMVHEFGHVLGNYDEYDGGFFENRAWWHDNDHHDEENYSLMGGGSQLHPRYFDHIANQTSTVAGERYEPRIVAQPSM